MLGQRLADVEVVRIALRSSRLTSQRPRIAAGALLEVAILLMPMRSASFETLMCSTKVLNAEGSNLVARPVFTP